MSVEKFGLYLAGEWVQAVGRTVEPVLDPADGQPFGEVAHATSDDLDRALVAARSAFAGWSRMPAAERGALLRRAGDLILERKDGIAAILTREQGKPLREALQEVLVSVAFIHWNAEEATRSYGRIVPGRRAGVRVDVTREPIGPVAAFTPWNFPFAMPARKVSTALAAGCTCILKPSEETPGTGLALAQALHDAGLPAGVLSVVFGVPSNVSEHLISSDIVRKVTFTGSVPVGRRIAGLAARGIKPATLELGGHSPVLVFDDCDLDEVSRAAVETKFRNAGQQCISPTRFFVQSSVYQRFAERFIEHTRRIKVGRGTDETTGMGPLANVRRLESIERLVADARARGGTVRTGGQRIGNAGYFFEPTVITDVAADADAMHQEPFGPLALLAPFDDEDAAIGMANSLPYGLASYAFTADGDRQRRLSDNLDAGVIGLNTFAFGSPDAPFGGVKDSGYGSESGIEGFEAFTTPKAVTRAMSRPR